MSVSFHRKRKISDDRITINSGFDWTFMTVIFYSRVSAA
jgi:hypothetical protein